MALITTPGAPDANSYVTELEADAYFLARLFSTAAWNDFVEKEALLTLCTNMLDWYMNWEGTKATSTQSLDWPRVDVYIEGFEVSPSIVPDVVKTAVFELAVSMMNSDITQDWALKGFKKVEAGALVVEVDGSADNRTPNNIPDRVYKILSDVLLSGGSNSISVVRLIRA